MRHSAKRSEFYDIRSYFESSLGYPQPLDPLLAEALGQHRDRCPPTPEGWLFANPRTGRPYHQEEIQKRAIRKAAQAAGIDGSVGWHTFRHSYRAWLDDTGAPMGVQKELMRHASIQTTMDVYGKAMSDRKREANSKVVEMVLPADAVFRPRGPGRKAR